MRSLLVLGLVAAALAASGRYSSSKWEPEERTHIREHVTRPGREYRFEYNGQVASGLPQASEQHSATRVQALVSVFVKDPQNAVMKIRQVRFGSLNKVVAEPREIVPFDACEEIEIQPEHEQCLKMPVRVRYEQGLVRDLEFDQQDQPWCKNIKKAIVNLMQVNLQKNGRTDLDEIRKLGREEDSEQKTQDFYLATEKGLEGECEHSYTVVPQPRQSQDDSNIERLQVTKSVNFEKCTRRPDLRYNLRFGSECKSCEKKFAEDEKNTESSTVFNYNITRRGQNYLVREAEVKSQYVFAPLAQSENVITTHSLGRLVLNDIQENVQVPKPRSPKTEDIVFSVEYDEKKELFHMNGDEDYLEYFPYGDLSNKVALMDKVIGQMLKHMTSKDNSIDAEAPHMMARLVKLLRWATKEDLQKLIRTYYTESQQLEQEAIVKVQGIFADCLAIAGTKNTIEALSQMIQEKKISPVKASQVIKALVNLPVPSEKQIDTLLRLCQSSQSERNPILKQSCWLTTGAVMNALCAENKEKFAVEMMRDEKMMCPRQLKEKYVKVLMEQYHKAETRYEKVLALKTLANAGLDMSVMELEKIIRNERLDKTVRIQAIDALRLLRDQMPRKIQNILMPVLKNKYEHPEIRMNCYYQIMETLPQRHILDQIAAQLRFEPSQQLQSFVYTHMMQLANSTNPCQIQLADDLKTSLRVAHVQPPRKLLQSRFQHLPLYWQQTLTGASLNWAAIFSNNSFVPKEMMASIDTVFAGEWNKYALQFGLSQQNVDQLIAKLAEILKMDKLENIVVRGKRATGPAQDMLRDLFKSLQIRGRKGESQEAHAMLYMRYKGLDYAFLPIDQETIPETIKNTLQNGQFKLAAIERFLATGYNFDTSVATYFYESTRKIATSIGMPLVISGKLPTVLSIRGQIKVDLTPKDSQKLTGAKVRMMLEPRISATHITKMEVWCPITNNGIKVLHQLQAVLPIESTIQITKEAEILAIETSYKMPTQEKRLLAVQSRPVTFTRQWQKNGRVYTEAKEKTCMSEMMDDHVDIDKVYGEDEFGVRMNIDGHWHRSILRERQPGQPSPLLVGNNYLVCVFQPTDQTPKEIKTRIEIENIDEMESMEDPEMDNFYSKKVQFGSDEDDLFETEDFEGFDEDEQERRQHFKRYTKSISSSSKGYKHRLTAKFETVGGVRRQGEFVLQSVCDEELRVCKWDIKCEHTPFTRAQSSKWTLQAKIQAVYPKMAYTLQELKEQKHREFTLQMDAAWGTQKKSQMTVKIQGEQNAEQKKWMQHVEMKQNEKKQPVEIYEQMLEASQLNQYKMVVEYDLTPKAQNYFNQMYETLKAWYYRECEITLSKTSDNQITAKLTIDPRYRQLVNFTVETPVERLRLLDVQLPVKVQPLNIRRELSSYRSLSSLVKKGVVGPLAECVVKSTRVNTFDDVLYKAPISTCYSVLAKDCSDEESKFVVLMKKISQNSEEKKLKVISQEHVIEIEQPKNDEPLEITVNGKKLNKQQQQRQLQEYNIELKQEGELVTIELDDVTVHFDGYSARVQLSPLYLSQQCGICGHYDGERSDEFRRNDNELTDDLQDFHRSYLHRDQECEMDEEEYSAKHYRRFDSEEQDREEQEQSIFAYDEDEDQEFLENEEQESREQPQQRRHRKFQKKSQQEESSEETEEQRQTKQPIKRTRVIERSSEVCFSSRPVPECPRQTYPQEPVEKDVKFACFPRSHSKVREMLRQARTGVVDVEGEKNSFVEPIRVPTLCSVY